MENSIEVNLTKHDLQRLLYVYESTDDLAKKLSNALSDIRQVDHLYKQSWQIAVAYNQTTLGFNEWMKRK